MRSPPVSEIWVDDCNRALLEDPHIPMFDRPKVDAARHLSIFVANCGAVKMINVFGIFRTLFLTLGIGFGLGSTGYAHSGIVDGYGCHRAADKVTYHCHQGQFVGRTFKSKEDFLRQVRSAKSPQLSKSNPPRIERKVEE